MRRRRNKGEKLAGEKKEVADIIATLHKKKKGLTMIIKP